MLQSCPCRWTLRVYVSYWHRLSSFDSPECSPSRPDVRQMRDNIMATNLLALDVYDSAFKKRQVRVPQTQTAIDGGNRWL